MIENQAIVFPGQGSQSVGMLGELAIRFPSIKTTFAQASDCLGYDLWALVQQGPAEQLNQTVYTQVAMLTADLALFQVFNTEIPSRPLMMAGHSLGEYAALVAAEALSLTDAVALVQTRARLMQETIPEGLGAMAAIVGLANSDVVSICDLSSEAGEYVSPANYNALGQVVIAGHRPAVLRAIDKAEHAGARLAKIIPVSVPCHCDLLKPAAALFAKTLAATEFNVPILPVISNVDLTHYQSVDAIRGLLCQQLYSPVLWVDTIVQMKAHGVKHIIECGPGKVLSGLIKRIDNSIQVSSVVDELLQLSA